MAQTLEDVAANLAHVIRHWLSFQVLCGREALLSESYMAQPIGEFLIGHFGKRLSPEHNHPAYAGRVGRPRQVDFAILSGDRRIQGVIETKWVGSRALSKSEIVEDLLRLEAFRDPSDQHVKRYFVVAGLRTHFCDYFANLTRTRKRLPFTTRFLSFKKVKKKVVDIEGAPTSMWTSYFKPYESAYGEELPKRFKTELIASSQGSPRLAYSTSVFIWRVESNRNRATVPFGAH